jgi:hypothetical protein
LCEFIIVVRKFQVASTCKTANRVVAAVGEGEGEEEKRALFTRQS